MASYLITGCSRGLGLGLVAQLAALPPDQVGRIFATARTDSSIELKDLISQYPDRIVFVMLDTSDQTSITNASEAVAESLGGMGLDVLINNAAIMQKSSEGIETMNNLSETFNANVASVHNVTSAFLPLLRKGSQKKVFNISSTAGSLTVARKYQPMPIPAYKVCKAALNMLTVQYALSMEEEGFTFIAICPGWLRTDMGNAFGVEGDLPVSVGAMAVLEIVHKYGKEHTGRFYNIRVPGWEKNEGLNQYDGLNSPCNRSELLKALYEAVYDFIGPLQNYEHGSQEDA
ncbi:MAG: hypothetical protein L6R40_006113 [Gallowayella cf. fulva]|nr:MAG: hypothetical protein L6R40_006113 [Xanthomendoza cf. fulva]